MASLGVVTPEAERAIGESIAVCAQAVPPVRTVAGFDLATADLTDVKARLKKLEELRKGITGPLLTAKAAVDALFDKPRRLLQDRETALKDSLQAYMEEKRRAEEAERRRKQEEAERKAAAERARLEEEARKQREAAEKARREAEAARAKADEERRKREEAERKVEEERRAKEKAKLAAARAEERRRLAERFAAEEAERKRKADEEHARRLAAEEKRQAELLAKEAEARAAAETAQARAEVTVAAKVEVRERYDRSKGVTIRRVWTYEVTNFAKLPDEFKLPNSTKLSSLARSQQERAIVPGVRFFQESGVSAKAAV